MTTAFELRRVGFTYRSASRKALDGVDLEVPSGQVVVVVGASGAGKSTLCLCLDGLIPHFVKGELEGDVLVGGTSTREGRVAELAQQVGLVFQDFEAQLFSTNVELEVAFGPENFAIPVPEIDRRVREALAMVDLVGLERREPATLSGGQKQRLAIASVLALQPDLLVMDEPTTDLDPIGTEGIFAVAGRLRETGITLVIVEHETEEATAADRVVVLEEGRMVADGRPEDVLTRSDWLEGLGVQPLGSARLLEALGEPPELTVDRTLTRLEGAGYRVDRGRWEELVRADADRAGRYGDPVIEVEGLRHRYPNGVLALDGIDLVVRAGEFLGVVGHNGSGKTTLVKHLNGLLHPTEGEVRVKGASTRGQSVQVLGRTVGYVFQNPDHQIFAETVREEVAFGPRNHEVAEEQVAERVSEALRAVGMSGREEEDPFTLTKGERQRVAVASILATRPDVLVLDEPTTGLDYREQRRMMELVRSLNETGHTIVCVTHTMWVVAEYAHRMAVVQDGRILMDGPTREVMSREEELGEAHLKPPHLPRISRRLGGVLLTMEECRRALHRVHEERGA